MVSNNASKIIYQPSVLEFVTVGIEYCAFLEKSEGRSREDFMDTMLKLLPLLYVKAQLLPEVGSDGSWLPNGKVTENDYNFIRRITYDTLGDDDQYLDVLYEANLEGDDSRWKAVSEHLADIYQPVRNFLATYQDGVEECMVDALWDVRENFELYWGQALVDAMKRLHHLKYSNREVGERW